jgi:UDP-N-acetylmuramate: L-alanyl-gamma-D-glutamyl-meso-diaminopimelate ligase
VKIHLIGIGGTGMGALAGLLVEAGHEVRGSDGPLYPPMSTLLEHLGVPLFLGHRAENLDWGPDRVVVGNVCRRDHPEAVAAAARNLALASFPSLLEELFLADRRVVVVAGTHGKTTTSSLLAHVLSSGGLEPGFLVGGIPKNFGRSYALGRGPLFVVEGDEYDTAFFDKRPKFVHYRPETVILTSVEYDHADIYPSMEAVEAAFAMLIGLVPASGRVVVCADSPRALAIARRAACPVETYSVGGVADWTAAARPAPGSGRQLLSVSREGAALDEIAVPLTGRHNLSNALAVLACVAGLGLDRARIARGLETFLGVERRQDLVGIAGGVAVVDDFAHHPTAIRETLLGLRGVYGPGRLVAVFEPRSATSKRRVFQEGFAEALAVADHAVVAPLHAAEKVPERERLDARRVAERVRELGRTAFFPEGVGAGEGEASARILEHLAGEVGPGDTVVVMSSGGFDGLPRRLALRLGGAAAPGGSRP